MTRAVSPSKKSRISASERWHQVIAITMTAIASAGLFAATNIKIVRSQAKPAIMLSDDEIQTGSILFVPDDEKVCRQFLFDNRTGWLTYIGFVDCEGAFNKDLNEKTTQFAAWRAKVISESFRGPR